MADQPRRGRRWSPTEAVADQLRRRILSGDVPDGGLLPKIDDLMAEFGVSQPAVSSACAILEPLCAQLCAERPDRERAVLPALDVAQQDLADAIEQADGIAATEAARRWHEALADGCGNETTRVLLGALELMWTSHSRANTNDSVARGVPYSDKQSRQVHAEHAAIAEPIAAGKSAAAAEAVREHLRTARIHGQPTDAPATGAVRADLVRDSLSGWPGS